MIILGIDPGIAILGFAFLEKKGSKIIPIEYGVIRTSKKLAHPQRLKLIFEELNTLIEKYDPSEVAVEKLFFSSNVKTAFEVGAARGVALLTAALKDKPVFNYTPNEIKISVTGYGKADKKQVQKMVKQLLGLDKVPKPDDAADAVACGICHIYSRKIKVLK